MRVFSGVGDRIVIGVVSGSEKVKRHPSFPKVRGILWKLGWENSFSGLNCMTIVDSHSVLRKHSVCLVEYDCNI